LTVSGPQAYLYLTERGDPQTDLRNARVVGHVVLRTADGLDYGSRDHYVATDPPRVDADGVAIQEV